MICGYMRKSDEWKVWAGKITGMILESSDRDLKEVLKDEKSYRQRLNTRRKCLNNQANVSVQGQTENKRS